MNYKLLFLLLFLISSCSSSDKKQQFKGEIDKSLLPVLSAHYQVEYDGEKAVNPEAWNNQQGLHVAFGSTDRLYFRKEVPESINNSTEFKAVAWKGERVNAQLLVWSSDTLNQIRFRLKDLTRSDGKELNTEEAGFRLVRYVISNYHYGARNAVCGESPYPNCFMMPDRFVSFERFDLPGKSVRPVWFSLDIPQDALPGTYTGIIQVKSEKETVDLPISVQVRNQTLPKPHEWKHRLDLWQNPWAVAWYNHVEPWSAEHKALLRQHLKLYADAGGTFITTYAVHSPWSDNSFRIEGGMIVWIKQKAGGWEFDYTIFDEYVELAMECGIDRAITVYTPIPWGNRFRYMDEATGNYVYESWSPADKVFTENWNSFLTDFKKHLINKGWFNITYLGINENEMKQTLDAIKMIKAHSPDWKITYAGNWHQELDSLLDDYCFLYGNESTVEQVKARKARGATTTFYVCCNPSFPNNFVFSPPVEGRWLGWHSAACGYDGFLRWAYDAWTEDPNRDARFGYWPAGDCFMVYPGGNSCIRYEKLREGIVDFEKIRILREEAAESADNSVKQSISELERYLNVFVSEKTFDEAKIAEDINKGKELINQISEQLAK